MVEEVSKEKQCSSCAHLKQELESTKKDQASTLKMIKEKIISTDKLIKKYQKKCDDFEKQGKSFKDLNNKYEECKRINDDLQEQLNRSLEVTEPQKKNIRRLLQEKFDYEAKILELNTQNTELQGKISCLESALQGKDDMELERKKDQQEYDKKLEKEKERYGKLKKEISKLKDERNKDKVVLRRKARELSVQMQKREELQAQVNIMKQQLKTLKTQKKNNKADRNPDESPDETDTKLLRSGKRVKTSVKPSAKKKNSPPKLQVASIFDEMLGLDAPPLSPLPVNLEDSSSSDSDSSSDDQSSDSDDTDSLSDLGDALETELEKQCNENDTIFTDNDELLNNLPENEVKGNVIKEKTLGLEMNENEGNRSDFSDIENEKPEVIENIWESISDHENAFELPTDNLDDTMCSNGQTPQHRLENDFDDSTTTQAYALESLNDDKSPEVELKINKTNKTKNTNNQSLQDGQGKEKDESEIPGNVVGSLSDDSENELELSIDNTIKTKNTNIQSRQDGQEKEKDESEIPGNLVASLSDDSENELELSIDNTVKTKNTNIQSRQDGQEKEKDESEILGNVVGSLSDDESARELLTEKHTWTSNTNVQTRQNRLEMTIGESKILENVLGSLSDLDSDSDLQSDDEDTINNEEENTEYSSKENTLKKHDTVSDSEQSQCNVQQEESSKNDIKVDNGDEANSRQEDSHKECRSKITESVTETCAAFELDASKGSNDDDKVTKLLPADNDNEDDTVRDESRNIQSCLNKSTSQDDISIINNESKIDLKREVEQRLCMEDNIAVRNREASVHEKLSMHKADNMLKDQDITNEEIQSHQNEEVNKAQAQAKSISKSKIAYEKEEGKIVVSLNKDRATHASQKRKSSSIEMRKPDKMNTKTFTKSKAKKMIKNVPSSSSCGARKVDESDEKVLVDLSQEPQKTVEFSPNEIAEETVLYNVISHDDNLDSSNVNESMKNEEYLDRLCMKSPERLRESKGESSEGGIAGTFLCSKEESKKTIFTPKAAELYSNNYESKKRIAHRPKTKLVEGKSDSFLMNKKAKILKESFGNSLVKKPNSGMRKATSIEEGVSNLKQRTSQTKRKPKDYSVNNKRKKKELGAEVQENVGDDISSITSFAEEARNSEVAASGIITSEDLKKNNANPVEQSDDAHMVIEKEGEKSLEKSTSNEHDATVSRIVGSVLEQGVGEVETKDLEKTKLIADNEVEQPAQDKLPGNDVVEHVKDFEKIEEVSSKTDFDIPGVYDELCDSDLQETLQLFCNEDMGDSDSAMDLNASQGTSVLPDVYPTEDSSKKDHDIQPNKLVINKKFSSKSNQNESSQKSNQQGQKKSKSIPAKLSINDVLDDCLGVFSGVLPVLEPLPPSPTRAGNDSDIKPDFLKRKFFTSQNLFGTSLDQKQKHYQQNLPGSSNSLKEKLNKQNTTPTSFQTIKHVQLQPQENEVLGASSANLNDTTAPRKKAKKKKKKKGENIFSTRPAFLSELQYTTKALKHLYANDVDMKEMLMRLSNKDNLSTTTTFAAALMVFKNNEDFMIEIIRYFNERNREQTTPDATSLMSSFEQRVMELLKQLENVEHLKGLSSLVVTYLYKAILFSYLKPGKDGPDKRSIASYCRIMCGLCRQKGDLPRMRILCYDIIRHLYCHPGSVLYLVTSIAAVWPAVFSYSSQAQEEAGEGIRQPLVTTMHVIVVHMVRTVNWSMLGNIVNWFCSWKQVNPGISNLQELSDGLVKLMKDPSFAQLMEDKDGYPVLGYGLYEVVKSLELISCVQGWLWLNNVLIRDVIWDVLSSWASQTHILTTTKEQDDALEKSTENLDSTRDQNSKCLICEPTVVATIRLLGLVCRLAIEQQHNEIPHVISMLLGILHNKTQDNKVTFAIQLATAYSLLEISPWQPQEVESALNSWKEQQRAKRVLPESIVQGLNALQSSLLATGRVQTQHVIKR